MLKTDYLNGRSTDINGMPLPPKDVITRNENWSTKTASSNVPKDHLIALAQYHHATTGKKPTKAFIPSPFGGLKSFGTIVKGLGFINLELEYNAEQLAVK